RLRGVRLRGARLRRARLRGARLRGARLRGVRLRVRLPGVRLRRAGLRARAALGAFRLLDPIDRPLRRRDPRLLGPPRLDVAHAPPPGLGDRQHPGPRGEALEQRVRGGAQVGRAHDACAAAEQRGGEQHGGRPAHECVLHLHLSTRKKTRNPPPPSGLYRALDGAPGP
ncbi:MAG: pentapeptide repeat-containing protein, partial [Myxococcales bacterium]|nr:pentapeptide repeat-containing protein [Myxococcales bacterium]